MAEGKKAKQLACFDADYSLHTAAIYCTAAPELMSLIEAAADQLQVRGGAEQKLPLHIASEHSESVPVIELMIEQFPAALLTPDAANNLPLHYAILRRTSNAAVDIVTALTCTAEIYTPTSLLHHACEHARCASVVQLVADSAPDAVYDFDKYDGSESSPVQAFASACRSTCTTSEQLAVVSLSLELIPERYKSDVGLLLRVACANS